MSTKKRSLVPDPVITGFNTLRSSASLLIFAMGAILFLTGFALQAGVWAAILPIWGAALMLFGGTAYTIFWWSYQ